MKNKTYFIGAIILLTFLTSLWSLTNDWHSESVLCKDRYGKEDNELRIEKNIPVIEVDWVIHECDTGYISWSNRANRVTTSEPMHLGKTLSIRKNALISEEDQFHYEGEGKLAYRLVVKYAYPGDSVSYSFIKYFRNTYPPTTSFYVDKHFADSIFREWGFPEYYE